MIYWDLNFGGWGCQEFPILDVWRRSAVSGALGLGFQVGFRGLGVYGLGLGGLAFVALSPGP